MKSRLLFNATLFIVTVLVLSDCNLPNRQLTQTPTTTPISLSISGSTPTPTPLCTNQYFPNVMGDTWNYRGNNSAINGYDRMDTIIKSSNQAFTLQTTQSNVTYTINYGCSALGLTSLDPVEQYVGALLNQPDVSLSVILNSVSGISLPATINLGDTWQQFANFSAAAPNFSTNGKFEFDYKAVDYETVTVPFGTFNALRIDATIKIEVTGLKIVAGTYTMSFWLVRDIGIVKSEGTSHVPGVDFSDSMELIKFTSSQ